MPGFAELPKRIYSLWLQGAATAPDLVRVNFERWSVLNQAYRLEVLEEADVRHLLNDTTLAWQSLPPQALSDIVRARLLATSGGIWVDASLFPVRPLDDWLPQALQGADFFAFERPARDRLIASWFLAANRRNPFMEQWWAEIARFWSKPRKIVEGPPANPLLSVSAACASDEYPYYWFHYLFQYILDQHPELEALWARSAKLSGREAHRLQKIFLKNSTPSRSAISQALRRAPVQKLNWRETYPIDFIASLC